MNGLKINKILKSEFIKLNEDDLMLITYPGRMGDEDGSTFIIKHDNELTTYRVDGWLYQRKREKVDISLDDMLKHFPKWLEVMKCSDKKEYKGKYKYLYMGFGNGLCIDNSIYSEFEPYLNDLVEEYLKKYDDGEKESFKYAAVYNVWEDAFINMAKDKGYVLKQ